MLSEINIGTIDLMLVRYVQRGDRWRVMRLRVQVRRDEEINDRIIKKVINEARSHRTMLQSPVMED